uniref:Uncharacterized protein n=1 Tax=Nelumbo nucifera TaxID=4432 RepID=A0A822ZX51_NELNU|nr:TPA_asm: hypothetical protein HUJ06_017373 [Nelumbo nucifera]
MGRKRVYGMTLMLMVICSIASGLSFGQGAKDVMATLCFFHFWLEFDIGGDSIHFLPHSCLNSPTRRLLGPSLLSSLPCKALEFHAPAYRVANEDGQIEVTKLASPRNQARETMLRCGNLHVVMKLL